METLFAFTILLFVAAFVFGKLSSFRSSADLDQAVNETLGLLREARSKTLGSENSAEYGVHFASTTVTLFSGITYNPADPNNIVANLPRSVIVSGLTLATTTASVVFERISGRAAAAGTVTFSSTLASSTKVIQILPAGLFNRL